jgi:hypothetical protein
MYIRVLACSNLDHRTVFSIWGLCLFVPDTSANCYDVVSCRVRPNPFRSFPRCVTTVSIECMDVDIRDEGESTPSRSGYSSPSECII